MAICFELGYVVPDNVRRFDIVADVAGVQPVVEELKRPGIVFDEVYSSMLSLLPVIVVESACEVLGKVTKETFLYLEGACIFTHDHLNNHVVDDAVVGQCFGNAMLQWCLPRWRWEELAQIAFLGIWYRLDGRQRLRLGRLCAGGHCSPVGCCRGNRKSAGKCSGKDCLSGKFFCLRAHYSSLSLAISSSTCADRYFSTNSRLGRTRKTGMQVQNSMMRIRIIGGCTTLHCIDHCRLLPWSAPSIIAYSSGGYTTMRSMSAPL
jgi:hypothetical protein